MSGDLIRFKWLTGVGMIKEPECFANKKTIAKAIADGVPLYILGKINIDDSVEDGVIDGGHLRMILDD